jgi:sarcosine oxidase
MRYDVAVIGLGAMGSATAFRLARRSAGVIGLDSFARAHSLGSSGGKTRIIRTAYFEHPDYVPLLRSAWERWGEVEAESGERLVTRTGGLYAGRSDGELVSGARRSAEEHGLAHELLSASELRERYPVFKVDDDWIALFEEQAGFIVPEKANATHLSLAERHGADLRFDTPVRAWSETSDGFVLETDGESISAARVVVTAGAWLPKLLPDLAPLLAVERMPIFWFEPTAERERFAKLPVFIIDEHFYGFPYLEGQGLKVARHHSGVLCDPDRLDRVADEKDEQVVREFMRVRMPLADGPRRDALVCMYTNTPDRHFLIDQRGPRLTYASACSGHGFKFASVVGEILADLALDGRTAHPIGFLSAARFAR